MADITTYTVPRTGRRPLRFQGERIASADNSGPDDFNWTEAAVYHRPMYPDHAWTDKSETRGYVLAISHMTCVDNESDQHHAFTCDTLGELAANIEELPAVVADALFEQLGIVEDLDAKEGRP